MKVRLGQKRYVDIADNADFATEKSGGRLLDVWPVGFPVHKCWRDRGRGKQKNQKRRKCNQQAAQINPSWLLQTRSAWPGAAFIDTIASAEACFVASIADEKAASYACPIPNVTAHVPL
jgi:hypothetical protein